MADIRLNEDQIVVDDNNNDNFNHEVEEYVNYIENKCYENFRGRYICGYIDLERGFFVTWTRKVGLQLAVKTTDTEKVMVFLKIEVRATTTKPVKDEIKRNKSWVRAEELASMNMCAMKGIRRNFEHLSQIVMMNQNLKTKGVFRSNKGFAWIPGFKSFIETTPIYERKPFDLVIDTRLTLKQAGNILILPSMKNFSLQWKGFAKKIYVERERIYVRTDLWEQINGNGNNDLDENNEVPIFL